MSLSKVNYVCKLKNIYGAARYFSVTSHKCEKYDCKFVVVGGGSAGCAMAAKITKDFPSEKVIVLEPSNVHYYQPMFTLVGAGAASLGACGRGMASVLPGAARWLRDSASSFSPQRNCLTTAKGDSIHYDYMVLATGMQLNYNAVPGLEEGLADPDSGVCSIYSPAHVENTWRTLQGLREGQAVFTFPNSPVKCPGAPQKIMYLCDSYLREKKLRDKVKVSYYSSLGVIFGVKKYADALWKVAKGRDIGVTLRTHLVEVRHKQREAVFQNLDKPEEKFTVQYSMLHSVPPMGPPTALVRAGAPLVNAAGFVTVNKASLQHTTFPNIFALGDCCDSPNSKTAAAVAAQSQVVQQNLQSLVRGRELSARYGGYASCPLVTSYNTCILAEFNYDLEPTETFPVNQAVERRSMFYMKKYAMPALYWTLMTRGLWNGPQFMRSLLNPFRN